MPWLPSTSDQIRASAICPTAAAPWLSSSFSGPRGNFRRLRPSAIEPDETTRTSRPSPCSLAMSAASADSHDARTSPASESISSDEPTLTTMRRKFLSAGRAMERDFCREASNKIKVDEYPASALRRRAPGLGLRRAALGLERYRGLADDRDQRPQRFLDALAGGARHQQRRFLRGALQALLLLLQIVRRHRVDLVERDDLDLVGELPLIGLEFGSNRLVGLAGMFAGRVDEMQQHAAALDMAQKPVAEAGAFVGALDQTRNIRQHEFTAVRIHDAKLGMQRGEGIIGNLRFGRADHGEEGRFAGIGQADESGVGDQ